MDCSRWRSGFAVVSVALVLLAGCDGGSSGSDSATTTTTVLPTAPVAALATSGPSDASAPFSLYAVEDGETAPSIASRHGIELGYLLAANPDLRNDEGLVVGQILIIPSGNGLLVHVLYGETLRDIAERYGVTVESILNWPGNQFTSPDQISADQLIFIPNAVVPIVTVTPTTPNNP